MLTVNWKGKVGYGDIVSPICYAHNVSSQLDTKVKLVFHWPHDSSFKQYDDDPETLMERASFIYERCVKANVVVEHRYNSLLPKNFHHDNYEYVDGLHNYWYSTERNIGYTEEVVVCGTHLNHVTMEQYGKTWKDPLGEQQWAAFTERLKNNFDVQEVSYRTPIDQLFRIIRRAKVFIGYHGSAAWAARFVQIPMVVFTNRAGLTGSSFNHAALKTNVEDDFEGNLDRYIRHSKQKLEQTHNQFANYKLPQSLVSTYTWN